MAKITEIIARPGGAPATIPPGIRTGGGGSQTAATLAAKILNTLHAERTSQQVGNGVLDLRSTLDEAEEAAKYKEIPSATPGKPPERVLDLENYEKRFTEAYSEAYTRLSNGMNREAQQRFDLLAKAELTRREGRIRKELLEAQKDAALAEFQAQLPKHVNSVALAPSSNDRQVRLDDLNDLIDRQVAQGFIRADTGERIRQGALQDIDRLEFDELLDIDVEAAAKALHAGEFPHLGAGHTVAARNAIAIERRRLEAKREAQRREHEQYVGELVADFEDARERGFDWRGPVSVGDLAQMARGTRFEGKFRGVERDARALAEFHQLSPLEQEQTLSRMRQGPKTGDEAELFGRLEAAHRKTKRELDEDPLSFAVEHKVIDPLPPLDLSDPRSMGMRARAADVAGARYMREVSPLTDDETDAVIDAIDAAPASGKAEIFKQLTQGFGGRHVKNIAGQVAGKKERLLAYTMGVSVESPGLAGRIMRGREILAENPKVAPQGADATSARESINTILGEAYQHNPEHHAAAMDAAWALYAEKSWRERDLSGIIDTSRMEEAAREATGVIEIDPGFFSSSYKIQPPRMGMTEDEFLGLVNRADFSAAQGLTRDEILNNATYESVGDGRYLVRVGLGYVMTDRGPFILDLSGAE